MKEKTIYEAIDGKPFDSEGDCIEYENSLEQIARVDVWLNTKEPLPRGQRTRARYWVLDYLASQGMVTPEAGGLVEPAE